MVDVYSRRSDFQGQDLSKVNLANTTQGASQYTSRDVTQGLKGFASGAFNLSSSGKTPEPNLPAVNNVKSDGINLTNLGVVTNNAQPQQGAVNGLRAENTVAENAFANSINAIRGQVVEVAKEMDVPREVMANWAPNTGSTILPVAVDLAAPGLGSLLAVADMISTMKLDSKKTQELMDKVASRLPSETQNQIRSALGIQPDPVTGKERPLTGRDVLGFMQKQVKDFQAMDGINDNKAALNKAQESIDMAVSLYEEKPTEQKIAAKIESSGSVESIAAFTGDQVSAAVLVARPEASIMNVDAIVAEVFEPKIDESDVEVAVSSVGGFTTLRNVFQGLKPDTDIQATLNERFNTLNQEQMERLNRQMRNNGIGMG